MSAINAGLRAFAAKGTWDKLLEPLLDVVKQNFAVRDAIRAAGIGVVDAVVHVEPAEG